ncbi:MAG: hypothetical protein LBF93_01785 [Zoogloeaceae bacterium]|jgi:hypothetical protein|nr:hypothetical protein [Zoogloeaceae bacterium]
MNTTIIDAENGALHIGEIHIPATATFDETLLLAPDRNTVWDVETGYKWIYIYRIPIDREYINFSLCFYQGRLFCAEIAFMKWGKVNHAGKIKPWSWDDWSEEEELSDEQRYNRWLDKTIGRKREFSWGQVVARYDLKSARSRIEILYVNRYLDALFGKNVSQDYLKTGASA